MIRDNPIVEIQIFVDGADREYFITGHNGRFNWELLQQFEDGLIEETPLSINAFLEEQAGIDYGTVTVLAQLHEVKTETQYGTGYGDVITWSGYYYIDKLDMVKVDKESRPPREDELDLMF